jgi:hypothetical protein
MAHESGDGRRRWFTEGGYSQTILDERHFEDAMRYVLEGQ